MRATHFSKTVTAAILPFLLNDVRPLLIALKTVEASCFSRLAPFRVLNVLDKALRLSIALISSARRFVSNFDNVEDDGAVKRHSRRNRSRPMSSPSVKGWQRHSEPYMETASNSASSAVLPLLAACRLKSLLLSDLAVTQVV